MYSPTTRLLTVLEVLQSQAEVNGPELAAKLEVDVRSVRRYITMLRDMGIPVDSLPGRYGVYYLRPGFRLPPLMFNNGEILAIVLGLMAVRHVRLSDAIGVESAAAKIQRVLPHDLQERARALQDVLTLNMPVSQSPSEDMLACVSLAAYQHTGIWIRYRGSRGEMSERAVDVYGVVYHSGFWYAVGYCHLRRDLRTFRLDRVQAIKLLDTTFEPPGNFDPLAYLLDTIASMSGTWMVEALLKTTLEDVQKRLPRDLALLEAVEGGVLLRTRADDLAWAARFLVRLDCPLTVLNPPQLREEMLKLADSIREMAYPVTTE